MLCLTPAGMQMAEKVKVRTVLAVKRAGSGLSDADRKILYEALSRIADNLQEMCRNGLKSENMEELQ